MFEATFFVEGRPRTKGNHRVIPRGGSGIVVGGHRFYRIRDLYIIEDDDGEQKAWEKAIIAAADEHLPDEPIEGPVEVEVEFRFVPPEKPKHPRFHIVAPDADKLARAIGDALTGKVWKDDRQIQWAGVRKVYRSVAGVLVKIKSLPGASIQAKLF